MRTSIPILRALAILLILGLAPGCGAPGPRSAPPAEGHAATPHRIVSLVPAVTQMLFTIGAGPRVVGVSTFDRFPPEVVNLPKVGGLLDPNIETIVRLRPDLVAIDASQEELGGKLAALQIPAFAYSHPGLADVTRTIRDLGNQLGLRAEAERAANSITSRLDDIRRRVAGRPRPTTLIVFGREPSSLRDIYASGSVGFLADIFNLAGGENVLAGMHRESLQVTTETILGARPEVIVELQPGDGRTRERQADEAWQTLASVPAVRNHRVYVLVGDEFVVPGPRVVEAAERIARVLHPEAFEQAGGRLP
jgi:iron complex transport system substrate-binding protein